MYLKCKKRENGGEGTGRGGKFHLDTYNNEFELKTKHLIAHVDKGRKKGNQMEFKQLSSCVSL